MDDASVRDSQPSTQDDLTLANLHASEDPTTKVEERLPNQEEHNRRQHKPENEHLYLLKLKHNEITD